VAGNICQALDGGGSSLVLRSDASGPAAVHIDASGSGLRADSASGITLSAASGGVALDFGGSGGDGGGGGGMFSVLSSGRRTFAVDGATGKMILAVGTSRYCSPCHRVPCSSRNEGSLKQRRLNNLLADVMSTSTLCG